MQILYTLMHKKLPVVELTLDDTFCVIIDIQKVIVIRNAETLSYIGMAPIYDNGTLLWYSTPAHLIM